MNILIFGAGQVGSCVASILAGSGKYKVVLADKFASDSDISNSFVYESLDVSDTAACKSVINKYSIDIICSCLPYNLGLTVAQLAVTAKCHYFDLTEDFVIANQIRSLAKDIDSIFMPQCGLAPGYVDMLVNDLVNKAGSVNTVEVRTGAIPQVPDEVFKHACSWSIDGLIHEYVSNAECLVNGKVIQVPGMSGLENIIIDDLEFEVFSTSGGVGSLLHLLQDRVQNICYKTIRYRGHLQHMLYLLDNLKLRSNLSLLRQVMLNAMPVVNQDKVIVDILVDNNRVTKSFYPKVINNKTCLAIQWTTAVSLCAVVDIMVNSSINTKNITCQDQISLDVFLANDFGAWFN